MRTVWKVLAVLMVYGSAERRWYAIDNGLNRTFASIEGAKIEGIHNVSRVVEEVVWGRLNGRFILALLVNDVGGPNCLPGKYLAQKKSKPAETYFTG